LPSKEGEDEEEIESNGGGDQPSGGSVAPPPVPTPVPSPPPSKEGEDEEEIESNGGGDVLLPWIPWERLCALADDHGDSLPCASPLVSGRILAELGNEQGDDVDVFRVTLASQEAYAMWRVSFKLFGDLDITPRLFDARGQNLELKVLAGEEGSFDIHRILPAGTYFLRVQEENGLEGEYELSFEPSLW
jgi:hypothetical protein